MPHHRKKTAERTQFLSDFINFLISDCNRLANDADPPRTPRPCLAHPCSIAALRRQGRHNAAGAALLGDRCRRQTAGLTFKKSKLSLNPLLGFLCNILTRGGVMLPI
ncbi:hypothetical protein PhaeoP71_02876 [Phaeobacter piscinae]|nr:hypothetical protein PhaeoP71_02876 [Phaeobacter piscinae]